MNISYYTIQAGLNPAVGFGYAGKNIVKSLNNLGHAVSFANPKSTIQLNFTQPHHFKLHRKQYQIGYTPWESTAMRPDWIERFNACDEVWATSNWCAQVFKDNGITKPIYVYPHGIEDFWKPKRRVVSEGQPIKFLHIGEPSPRKDGQLVVDTFAKLFGNNPDYQLTLKCHHSNTTRMYNSNNEFVTPDTIYSNIKIITDEYTEDQLLSLYHTNHILLYPTWGEGFGFIPLQALATGMPTICTGEWAEYKKYLGELELKSSYIPSPWPDMHPGYMPEPDFDHLCDLLKDVANRYNTHSEVFYNQAAEVAQSFDWLQLTNNAMKRIEEKF